MVSLLDPILSMGSHTYLYVILYSHCLEHLAWLSCYIATSVPGQKQKRKKEGEPFGSPLPFQPHEPALGKQAICLTEGSQGPP